MLNISSDIFSMIGSNEIDSFNKTLNEMLAVWNEPISSSGANNNSNAVSQQFNQSSSQQQLDNNINAILQQNSSSNGSFLNLPIPTSQNSLKLTNKSLPNNNNNNNNNNSNNNNNNKVNVDNNQNNNNSQQQQQPQQNDTNNSLQHQMINNHNNNPHTINTSDRSFLSSSQQQLDTFLFENSLFQTNSSSNNSSSSSISNDYFEQHKQKHQEDIVKTINEITIEQKSYQPIEIIPIKSIISPSSPTNTSSNRIPYEYPKSFNVDFSSTLGSFVLDQSKLEELRYSAASMMDPRLSMPYGNTDAGFFQQKNSSTNNKQVTSLIDTVMTDAINAVHGQQYSNKKDNTAGPVRTSPYNYENDQENSSAGPFALTRDELGSMSTTEMNEYIKTASGIKELTPVEKKELKRQKRLIKNRESAHLSRQRKRERLTDLEHRVEELSTASTTLTKTLTSLENENLVLKAEVKQLVEVIQDSPVLAALFCKVSDSKIEDMVGVY
eukprot:gene5275-6568_t